MKKFKKILIEAFTNKDLERAVLPFKRVVQSRLKGELADYVDALEIALTQAGESSRMSGKDLKDTIALAGTGPTSTSVVGKTMPTAKSTRPAIPSKFKSTKEVPPLSTLAKQVLKPAGGVSAQGSPLPPPAKPGTTSPVPPKRKPEVPVPPKMKPNVYTKARTTGQSEPKELPLGQKAAQSYLAGEDEPLNFDPGLSKQLTKKRLPGGVPELPSLAKTQHLGKVQKALAKKPSGEKEPGMLTKLAKSVGKGAEKVKTKIAQKQWAAKQKKTKEKRVKAGLDF